MTYAYYNEIDKYAAAWLRNLMAAGHIADGVVDERSIEDVHPCEIREFTQCHFFAGVGVWSHALRRAGWSDGRSVWTGSCPCQPFSAAGKGVGFDDQRHLWPHFQWLIQECRPPVVLGEQVASKDAAPWLDLVQDDLEGMGYAFGAVPFPAAGVGAPHIRDRLYWVANSIVQQRQNRQSRICNEYEAAGRLQSTTEIAGFCCTSALADAGGARLEGCNLGALGHQCAPAERSCTACALADTEQHDRGCEATPADHGRTQTDGPADRISGRGTASFWADADWIACRDGKARPVEPGTFPLAHGVANRVGRLRAYGNAICAPAAQAFIETVMGC